MRFVVSAEKDFNVSSLASRYSFSSTVIGHRFAVVNIR